MKQFVIFLVAFFSIAINAKASRDTMYNKRVFLIAISNYPEGGRWRNISCANDILHLKKGLSKFGFAENTIAVISDSYATKYNIMRSLDSLIKQTRKGDIVMVHYSGHAFRLKENVIGSPFKSLTYLISYSNTPCIFPHYQNCWKDFINTEELSIKLNLLRVAAGSKGQVLFTSDSGIGPNAVETMQADSSVQKTRGGFFDDFEKVKQTTSANELSPFIFMSGNLANQQNREIKDSLGNNVGIFSFAFANAAERIQSFLHPTYLDLHNLIKKEISSLSDQLATIAGDFNQLLFTKQTNYSPTAITQPSKKNKINGNCYIISIGINNYRMSRNFIQSKNSVSDANKMGQFINQQFASVKTDSSTIIYYELTDSKATKPAIYKVLNEVINQSKPDDYFIFNFCGFSFPYTDSVGRKEIYFAPSEVKDIADSMHMKNMGITLQNFKDLFELIPANNQLIITEAGSTENFQTEFVKKLFENAAALHLLTKRNRVIIVPNGFGLDQFTCNEKEIATGPLNYCITSLPSSLNIFSLFEDKPSSEKVEYAIKQIEMKCVMYGGKPYAKFFFEKQFMEELMYYMPENFAGNRSRLKNEQGKNNYRHSVKEKHALIIGTNKYAGKPEWQDLNNPTLDASEISEELSRNYGFKTKLLLNPSLDSIYDALWKYSNSLDSSDQFFIFIAGHGDYDGKFFDDGFLVFSNSENSQKDIYKRSYMQYAEFQKIINQLKARNIFVMLDVCFGGTFDAKIAQQSFRTKTNEVYADLENNTFLSEKLRFRSRIYMTSGGKNVVPDGYDKMHSPFAKQFLKALRDATERGMLTTANIFNYVEALPSGPRKGTFGSDEPGSEFIFLTQKK